MFPPLISRKFFRLYRHQVTPHRSVLQGKVRLHVLCRVDGLNRMNGESLETIRKKANTALLEASLVGKRSGQRVLDV